MKKILQNLKNRISQTAWKKMVENSYDAKKITEEEYQELLEGKDL